MRIVFHKGAGRNRLSCWRTDGSSTHGDVGPGLPSHDLCHLVGERALGLTSGFFGSIAAGRSIQELHDPRLLPPQVQHALARSEIAAHALGEAATGARAVTALWDEVPHEGQLPPPDPVVGELRALLARWAALPVGGSLAVDWPYQGVQTGSALAS